MSEVSKIRMNGVEYPIKDASAREQIDENKKKIDSLESSKATKEEVDVERNRISNLASLSDGSTTGDAELIDIRVGVDGTIYDSAGDAVRGQVDALQNDIDNRVSELKGDLANLKEPTRNLFKLKFGTFNGVTFSDNGDGGVKIVGTCTQSGEFSTEINPLYGEVALSYKCSQTYGADQLYFRCRNASGVIVVNGTIRNVAYTYNATVTEDNKITKCGITVVSGVTYNDVFYIQLENGTDNTEFIPNVSCADYVFRERFVSEKSNIESEIDSAKTDVLKDVSALYERILNYGHYFKTEEQIFNELKFSSVDYASITEYDGENWTYGTESTLDEESSRYLTSNGNQAGMYVQYDDSARRNVKNYIAIKVFVDGAEYLTDATITLKQVVGGSKNAIFNIKNKLKNGMNYIVLNRIDAESDTVSAWDWIREIRMTIQGTSGHAVTANFSKMYTFNMNPLVSITFDDGHITHYSNAFNYTKTLNPPICCSDAIIIDQVNQEYRVTDNNLREMIRAGWDIQSHTKSHKPFTTIGEDEIRYQISKAKEYLLMLGARESAFHIVPPTYARNAISEKVVKELCTAQKVCNDKYNNIPIFNPYLIDSFEVHLEDSVDDLTSKIDYAIEHNLWVVFTFHMIMDSGIYQSFSIDKFKTVCDYIQNHRDNITPCTLTKAFYLM